MANFKNINDEVIIEAIEKTDSMRKAAEYANIPFNTFKRKAQILNVYKPNQGLKGSKREFESKKLMPLDEILKGNHSQYQSNKLRKRLIDENIFKNECNECGLGNKWNGKEITLHLDHINGDSNDHRIENLRILCPNCHSQTITYCGRNKKFKL